jgi:hypothetical protein
LAETTYSEPVAKLLTLGRPETFKVAEWPDYQQEFGITETHIPELVRMALDTELSEAEEETPAWYAGVHAWRALGLLHAVEAAKPLLVLLEDEDNDWAHDDFLHVFPLFGPPVIPLLAEGLADTTKEENYRSSIATLLAEVAKAHPETRLEIINILADQLDSREEADPSLNGFIVSALIELNAVEAAPAIEAVFAADTVEEMINGDWNSVQVYLGLKKRSEVSTPYLGNLELDAPEPVRTGIGTKTTTDRKKAKSKRKIASASRKKNRKKK